MFRSPPKLVRIWSFLLALGLAVPTVGSIGTAPSAAATKPLVIIMMENHERSDIVTSSSAPYLNGLRTRGIDVTNYVAVTHPSLPNYLALASGSTAGKSGTDSISAGQISGTTTVWNQLESHGIEHRYGLPLLKNAAFAARLPLS
ncbi:MAG TPA: hypothetical protein VHW68_00150 [Actinomycetota bacterium]|jgi:hypothetical protein|nr:hypothetical protein [Actinomycetota bacterium]